MPDANRSAYTTHVDRAKQFMPFAALKGYYDLTAAQERTVEEKRELAPEETERIAALLAGLEKGQLVRLRYHDGEAYTTICGMLTRIDPLAQTVQVIKTTIPFDAIADVL